MAKKSKGILIMNNWLDLMIDILTPEQSIEVLKLIRAKKNGDNYQTNDEIVKTHWFHMEHNVEASIEKYTELCQRRSEYGKLGGAKPGNQNARKNNQNNQKQPKQAMEKDKYKEKDTYPFQDKECDSITSYGDVISSQEDLSVLEIFKN